MTNRDIINRIYAIISADHDPNETPIEWHREEERRYESAKKMVIDSGRSISMFYVLWGKAVDQYYIDICTGKAVDRYCVDKGR